MAIQKARESAARTESANNLRQIGLAAQQCHTQMGALPPGFGYFPGGPKDPTLAGGSAGYGNVFFHLLPYLEQEALYRKTAAPGHGPGANKGTIYEPESPAPPGIATTSVKTFVNPSDPGVVDGFIRGTGTFAEGWGAGCYAFSAQVFCSADLQSGDFLDWYARARLPQSIPDGASTTILFAEKYAVCGPAGTVHEGASAWAAAPAAEATPVFAHSLFPLPSLPAGMTPPTGKTSLFQVRPHPFRSEACQYWLPQTGRSSGILVGLADCSARLVAGDVSPATWWAACTPGAGDAPGPDW